MDLTQFIGARVIVGPSRLSEESLVAVLRGVEASGLWLESEDLTLKLLRAAGLQASLRKPLAFLPLSQVTYVVAFEEAVSLDESALGV
jgi:hypothetical protein